MSFKQAAVLGAVSFFLGVLFICFNVDHRILWGELTKDVVDDGFQFYTTFFNSPPAIKALLHGMVGVGLVGLVSKLHKWDESAMFFDGTSLGTSSGCLNCGNFLMCGSAVAYMFGIAVYLTVTIPALKAIVAPLEGVDYTLEGGEDRVQAIRVLSAGNIIVMVCLGGILCLQAGQEYARRTEAKALKEEQERSKVTHIKKNQ
ncbi:Secretory component protein SHR3 [Termitomyces sp. J132]|nr:Secretory component protein SHR3 [Termitomyces sp. J132]